MPPWSSLNRLVRSRVRDTYTVSGLIYTPVGGAPVSVVPEAESEPARPLKAEFTPLYESVSPAAAAVPSSGPRLEFLSADLVLCGIEPNKEGDVVTFVDYDGVTRTYEIVGFIEADVGSIYMQLGERR